jgi:hypothetical protein
MRRKPSDIDARIERLSVEVGRHCECAELTLLTIGAVLRIHGEVRADPARVLERFAEHEAHLADRLAKLETAARRLRANIERHPGARPDRHLLGGMRVAMAGMAVNGFADAVAEFRAAVALPEVDRALTPGMRAVVATLDRIEGYQRRGAPALATANTIDAEGVTVEET